MKFKLTDLHLEFLSSHLREPRVQQFLAQNVVTSDNRKFPLPLALLSDPDNHCAVGLPITVQGSLYEPADESGYMSIGTQLDTDSKKIGLLIREAPPIIIHLSSPADEAKKISLWLGSVLHHEMDRVVDLYFRNDVFSHEMLKRAVRLAQHIGDTMDNTMKLMILEIVMSHQICIPDDAKAALQKKVPELILEQGIAVSTRMINKLVKSVTVVIILSLSEVVISTLDKALETGDRKSFGECFCTMIFLLVVCASNQATVVDMLLCQAARAEPVEQDGARQALEHMESFWKRYVAKFHASFKTHGPRRNPFQSPEKTFGANTMSMVNNILDMTIEHGNRAPI